MKKKKVKSPNFRVGIVLIENGASARTGWVYEIEHESVYFPACRTIEQAALRAHKLAKLYEKEFVR